MNTQQPTTAKHWIVTAYHKTGTVTVHLFPMRTISEIFSDQFNYSMYYMIHAEPYTPAAWEEQTHFVEKYFSQCQ